MKTIHPLQSPLWGEFREKTGVKVVSEQNLLLTIHPIPHTKYNIGYLPKGPNVTQEMINNLWEIGKRENCIFIQIEPNIERHVVKEYKFKNLYKSFHPLFTKYNFLLDLTKSEEELLKNTHSKTRYNIRLAEKKGVKVTENNSEKAFKEYLRLTKETTQRQNFYAHDQKYHEIMREVFLNSRNNNPSNFTSHLLIATYKGKVLVAWLLFVLGDKLYYPYGASSILNREVMASNLMMWEAIKFGKKLGLKEFDMWGAANVAEPATNDIYYGFHKFKQGYGARLVEFVGSYDLVINPNLYLFYKILDKIRWFILRFK